jgi:hypothetical protein
MRFAGPVGRPDQHRSADRDHTMAQPLPCVKPWSEAGKKHWGPNERPRISSRVLSRARYGRDWCASGPALWAAIDALSGCKPRVYGLFTACGDKRGDKPGRPHIDPTTNRPPYGGFCAWMCSREGPRTIEPKHREPPGGRHPLKEDTDRSQPWSSKTLQRNPIGSLTCR